MKKQHFKKHLKNLVYSVLALAFFVLFGNTARAQGGGPGSLMFGGKLGITSSTLTNYGSNILYSENKVGFAAGGFVSYQASTFFGASVELLYAQEGASNIPPSFIYYHSSLGLNNMYRLNSNVTLHNIELPIFLNFYVPGFDNDVEPRFFLGGSFDLITKAVSKDLVEDNRYDEYSIILSKRSVEDVTSSFEYMNFGLVLGAGLNFYGGDINMTLDVRYKIGLRNINNLGTLNYGEYAYYEDYNYTDFSNNCLMVMVGIALP